MAISLFKPILSAIFVTTAMVKVIEMPDFYTLVIPVMNPSEEIGANNLSVFWLQTGPN